MQTSDESSDNKIELFLKTGIYRFSNSNAVFIDPVRVLNRSYTHHNLKPSVYYSRFFHSPWLSNVFCSRKRKRKPKPKPKQTHTLNHREQNAERRHQDNLSKFAFRMDGEVDIHFTQKRVILMDVRSLLLMAHEALVGATNLLAVVRKLRSDFDDLNLPRAKQSLDELAKVCQSPLHESLYRAKNEMVQLSEERKSWLFCNSAVNDTSHEVEAKILNNKYILPRKSCFYMSDLGKIDDLIPAESAFGFNIILIDPPWENGSARQKLKYPTLPNRYFLSLPVKQLIHSEGALVALWITNREKLRVFVENELFPSWGVEHIATHYWLKVKPDGSLIGDLDLFHHRPYECLLVGYHQREGVESNCVSRFKQIPDNQIIISIPGDYSRKPPIGELLLEYVPGPESVRSIELFAREMVAGWTSWGNEPLHFQESRYFSRTAKK